MKAMRAILAIALITVSATHTVAESDFYEGFKKAYGILNQDLLNNAGELGTVKDFVYKKDVATFTFKDGIIHLLRYVDDRPTTAIFIGHGNARIDIPCHLERQSLFTVARDSIVDEDFETCFIRIGDDFDLKLKERFTFKPEKLSWKNFNIASKKAQGEIFFKATIHHLYDNYFQLLRSIYERGHDGYFWIDFNRYVFSFDPNRPEEVTVAYEFQGGDVVATDGAVFQRREKDIYGDEQMSDIAYPTTIIDRQAEIEMGGMDGKNLLNARTMVKVLVNADSLRFVSMFLHYNLKTDSIYYDGQPVDYKRRKDFGFIGIILPEYKYAGDMLTFTLWYKGKQFDHAMPRVENPQVCRHDYAFTVPKGYNYLMPGMGEVEVIDNRRQRFSASSQQPFDKFHFQCYASGLDTVPIVSDIGITLNFLVWELMSKRFSDCYIPHETYQQVVTEAFNFMAGRFGAPPATFEVFVSPAGTFTMPGVMCVPQIACVMEGPMLAFGGFHATAGREAARQWFGSLMRVASDRELWIPEAVPEYVNLMFLQSTLGTPAYSNLLHRRDSIYTIVENKRDLPLAAGSRANSTLRANKGLWVLHMLRFLMYDLESSSERRFLGFLRELQLISAAKSFTNDDFVQLAEKHYGEPLDWFFHQWLYGLNYPEYDVEYAVTREEDGYFLNVDVKTEGVGPHFTMPVILRIVGTDESSTFLRQTVSGHRDSFELGPFAIEPSQLVFGEFYNVLCKSKVKKK